MNYQYQSKQMVIDALLKAVNSAPNSQMQNTYYSYYLTQNQPRTISDQDFTTWLKYVNSILDISFTHTGLNNILATKLNIAQVSFQSVVPYEQRVEKIKYELLNLAQGIL